MQPGGRAEPEEWDVRRDVLVRVGTVDPIQGRSSRSEQYDAAHERAITARPVKRGRRCEAAWALWDETG